MMASVDHIRMGRGVIDIEELHTVDRDRGKTREKGENDDKRKLHLMSEFYFQLSIWSIVNDHFSSLARRFINPLI
jgi:hypothetical protein